MCRFAWQVVNVCIYGLSYCVYMFEVCRVLASCSALTPHRTSRRRPDPPSRLATVISTTNVDRISPLQTELICAHPVNCVIGQFMTRTRNLVIVCVLQNASCVLRTVF